MSHFITQVLFQDTPSVVAKNWWDVRDRVLVSYEICEPDDSHEDVVWEHRRIVTTEEWENCKDSEGSVNFDIHATTSSPATSHETHLLRLSSASPPCSLIRVMASFLHSTGGLEPFMPKTESHPCITLSVVEKRESSDGSGAL